MGEKGRVGVGDDDGEEVVGGGGGGGGGAVVGEGVPTPC